MAERDEAIRAILELWEQLPLDARNDFRICLSIIDTALGRKFLNRHFNPDKNEAGIFRLSFGSTEEEKATRNYRAIDLAECLINLKDIEGLGGCLSRMKEADNPEALYAELHIAKMIYINSWPFRFVNPRGKRGDDYDLEIICHNYTRCGDIKCKLESTELSSGTIERTLRNSRDQLPPDGPGVFFLKLPQRWMENPDWQRITGQGAINFFKRGTQRVASVVFYVEPLNYRAGYLAQDHYYLEIINGRHKLAKAFDWHLFERWKPPRIAENTMPPFWIRLANFPTGLPGYDGIKR
jgi:hypothetical protein